jgi:flagellin FlaB
MKLITGSLESPRVRWRALSDNQRGVTGLETAIILIAFVVVASVFAFTVLSTGIFSAERGKETIHAGLKGARSSLELKGSVLASGVTNQVLSLANTAWTSASSTVVTSTVNTTDKKEGSASANLSIADGFTTGLVAYANLSEPLNLSAADSISVWAKYGTTTAAGDVELVLDDTSGCGSPLENIDLPVLVANVWKGITLAIADNDDMTAINCVGIFLTVDDGAQLLNIDGIVAQGQATNLILTLTNTLEGESIDVQEPSDSDGNGLSDSDSKHTMVLTYSDKNQVVRDIYWINTFIGNNDGDNLLESGEKVEINVILSGLSGSYPLIGDTKFDMEIRPEDGGTVVIQRTMPDLIDVVMNLN